MFIRIKKIKCKDYAYEVQNIWTVKGARQKTKAYLGRVIVLDKKNDLQLDKIIPNYDAFLKNCNARNLTYAVMRLELLKHGFREVKNALRLDKLVFDTSNNTIKISKKPVVLKMNDGFFCNKTIQKVLGYKPKQGKSDEEIGYEMAQVFVAAGLDVPKDVFVALYEKLVK